VLLSELLAPERVVVPLRGATKDEVIRELVAAALPHGEAEQRDLVVAALHAREALLSTGIGDGVAIPHAKTPAVGGLLLVAGTSARPVDYDALDGRPADLFFLLLGPESAATEHVKALGRISRVLRRPGLREQLRAAPDAAAFLRVIADSEAG
jgi:PTS system nitrogen regulatory IIA component